MMFMGVEFWTCQHCGAVFLWEVTALKHEATCAHNPDVTNPPPGCDRAGNGEGER